MTALKATFLVLIVFGVQLKGVAQNTASLRLQKIVDSASHLLQPLNDSSVSPFIDSTYLRLLPSTKDNYLLPTFNQSVFPVKRTAIDHAISAPLIQLQGGFIQYEWNYSSGIDTPFVETNISQHFVTGVANVLVKDLLPLRVTYFQRQSNSSLFRNIHDIRIELNPYELQRIQMAKLRRAFLLRIEQLADSNLYKIERLAALNKNRFNDWLTNPSVRKKYINSQELLLSADLTASFSSEKRDSVLNAAKNFVTFFEKVEQSQKKYRALTDSLSQMVQQSKQKISYLKSLVNGNLMDPLSIHRLETEFSDTNPADKKMLELTRTLGAIRVFEMGRTIPNFSPLTLRNINVKGVNFEYNRNNFYTAVAAGGIDYRMRDFIPSRVQTPSQSVLALRIGYGRKERNNLIFTYLSGRKQVYPFLDGGKVVRVQNISLSSQLMLSKYSKLAIEFAESITPLDLGTAGANKISNRFADPANQALAVGLQSIIPATKTKLEAHYQRTGINYQSFTNYSTNSSSTAWSVKSQQDFWKRSITLTGELRKNDFINPLVLQRYNANAVFKNLNLMIRRPHIPTVSMGYMPSSQYSVIDSVVYENHYQILNGVISHQYPIGEANCHTSVMFSRYYNDAKDSGFLYYNAENLFFSQVFMFPLFSVSTTISSLSNGIYTLNVWDGGIRLNLPKQSSFVCGVKMNKVSTDKQVRLGYYTNARFSVRNLGDLNLNLERNQYPDGHHQLQQRDFFTLSFTRNF